METKKKGHPKKIVKKHNLSSILNAAAKVFREKGYHHASMSDIANETGLLKGSLYHHISSKEELLRLIVLKGLEMYSKSVQLIMTSSENPDEILRKAIIAFMNPIDISFDSIAVFLNERSNLSKKSLSEVNKQIKNYESLWVNMIERGKKSKQFKKDIDSKVFVMALLGACQWTSKWYNPQGKYSGKELGEQYVAFFLDGIRITSNND